MLNRVAPPVSAGPTGSYAFNEGKWLGQISCCIAPPKPALARIYVRAQTASLRGPAVMITWHPSSTGCGKSSRLRRQTDATSSPERSLRSNGQMLGASRCTGCPRRMNIARGCQQGQVRSPCRLGSINDWLMDDRRRLDARAGGGMPMRSLRVAADGAGCAVRPWLRQHQVRAHPQHCAPRSPSNLPDGRRAVAEDRAGELRVPRVHLRLGYLHR